MFAVVVFINGLQRLAPVWLLTVQIRALALGDQHETLTPVTIRADLTKRERISLGDGVIPEGKEPWREEV